MHRRDWLHLGAHLLGPPAHVSINTPTVNVQAGHGRYVSQPRYRCHSRPIYIQRFPLRSRPVIYARPAVVQVSRPAPPIVYVQPVQYHPPDPSPVKVLRHTIVARGSPPPEHRIVIVINGNIRSCQME